jgi:hypothetical protein
MTTRVAAFPVKHPSAALVLLYPLMKEASREPSKPSRIQLNSLHQTGVARNAVGAFNR